MNKKKVLQKQKHIASFLLSTYYPIILCQQYLHHLIDIWSVQAGFILHKWETVMANQAKTSKKAERTNTHSEDWTSCHQSQILVHALWMLFNDNVFGVTYKHLSFLCNRSCMWNNQPYRAMIAGHQSRTHRWGLPYGCLSIGASWQRETDGIKHQHLSFKQTCLFQITLTSESSAVWK